MLLGLLAAALVVGAPQGAGAAGAGVIVYPAAFFAEARPINAMDMLQRVPGFSVSGGEAVRGFAGAGGNVLIDGERPTAKSVSLDEVLRRLPAGSVERIELIRGGAPGIDMQGQALVANVVRLRSARATTAVTLGAGRYGDGWVAPRADLEWTRRLGQLSVEGALHAYLDLDQGSGAGARTLATPSGAILETGPLVHLERGPTLAGSGAAELARGSDVWRLTLGGERQTETTRETVGRDLSTEDAVRKKFEVGGDYSHRFGPGLSGRVVALQTLERETSRQRSEAPGQVQTFDSSSRSRESILRATLTAERSPRLTLEAGGEGAFNLLDAASTAADNGVAVVLPNANVRVEERRAEGFVTAFWKPSAGLSFEAGSRAEISRISQSGDTRSSRSFFFPKPRLLATYTPNPASQIRLRIEREVGQLNFGDFAASSELSIQTINAGNADLEPERSWLLEATAERRFWGKGALVATFTHAEVQQVVDLIPIAGRFDAPGNIGDGWREVLKLTATAPMDRFGVSGGLLTVGSTWRRSRVTDPVTGRARRISYERPFDGFVRFSQDIASLRSTWGFEGSFGTTGVSYRIDEVRREYAQAFWSAFWEWKPDRKLSVRAELQNIGNRDSRLSRVLYDGPRSSGAVRALERRNGRFDPYVFLSLRREL